MDRLISENKVLEAIDNLKANFTCYDWVTLDEVASHVKALPSAEPTVAQERYEDLCEYFGGAKDILNNREDFKAWLGRIKWHIHKAEELYEKYEQEPKTGHWIVHEHAEEFYGRVVDNYECDNCGDWYLNKTNFCPHCGAKMD